MNIPGIVYPEHDSTLEGSSVTIRWEAKGEPVTKWWLSVGPRPRRWFLHNQDEDNRQQAEVPFLPCDGGVIYATVKYKVPNSNFWQRTRVFRWKCANPS